LTVDGVASTSVLTTALVSAILAVSSFRAGFIAQGSVPARLARTRSGDGITEGFIATLALLEAGLSEGAFGAGTVAVASLPAAGAGAVAADRIALGFVETRATVPAVGPPFVLRASYCASCPAVAGLAFALIGSYAGPVQALLSADRYAAAVIGRAGKTLAAVLHHPGFLH